MLVVGMALIHEDEDTEMTKLAVVFCSCFVKALSQRLGLIIYNFEHYTYVLYNNLST
jgi:hypothetical protein